MSDGDLVLRLIRIEQLLQAVHHSPCATLALVHGPCYGAAADLAAAYKWRFAAPDARFLMPGSRFGIVLGTRRLTALVGADAARRLVLRTRPFGAEEALAAGFVTAIAKIEDWGAVQAEVLETATLVDPGTGARLAARMTQDTRDADLAELVRSAAQGSIRDRVKAYLADMAAARAGRT